MATTTNYGWTTPDDTSLVKDGAAAIRTLGSSVDSTVFANASAGIAKSIVDAKGDLIAATAADTVSRLAVGTNNQVLTADSSTATGLKWAGLPSSTPANATASVTAAESSSSTSYADLATAGPAVTVTTGTQALVIVSARLVRADNADNSFMSFAVSGATTTAASDVNALNLRMTSSGDAFRASAASSVTLTAGSNTFTTKYRTINGNPATFSNRQIFVINLA
jgi:hypothetical protein